MKRLAWWVPVFATSLVACEAENTSGSCAEGSEGCECYANRTCDSGLICSGSDICVEDEESSGGSGDSGGSGGSGDSGGTDGGSSGSGGSGSGGSATNDSGGAASADSDGANGSGGASSTTVDGTGGATSTGGSNGGMGGSAGGETVTESTYTSTSGGGTTGETRTAIAPVEGWVDASTNDVGIQGGWYTFADDVSTIVPGAEPFFEGAGTAICVSGTVLPHENMDLSWGVAVGMDLFAVDEVAHPYDASAYGVLGLQFTVSGSLPSRLQINTTSPEGGTYCRRYESIAGSRETLSVYFSSMEEDCWDTGAAGLPPDPTQLQGFHIQVISSASETVSFDFCVEDVSAILE
ncbi:MAG TPA: hypothetical protein VI197_31280 [Polyangiaceae bacterium]